MPIMFVCSYPLDVTDAPEPSDVKYENIEYSFANRLLRGAATGLVKYTSLAFGFFLISLASAMRFNLTTVNDYSATACQANCVYKVCRAAHTTVCKQSFAICHALWFSEATQWQARKLSNQIQQPTNHLDNCSMQ